MTTTMGQHPSADPREGPQSVVDRPATALEGLLVALLGPAQELADHPVAQE